MNTALTYLHTFFIVVYFLLAAEALGVLYKMFISYKCLNNALKAILSKKIIKIIVGI